MKQLASVRTNLSFHVENKYELKPYVEVVLLTYKPEYSFNTKSEIQQKRALDETRLSLSTEGLNQMIANLQLTLSQLQQYEQMGVALNNVISAMVKDNDK
ncbi:MAG: hypothetical protein ACOVLC_08405 [Flavobacterium sp.]|jgi:hypothetical protein